MKKEEYLGELKSINDEIKVLEKKKDTLRDYYIEKNKPCNIDDEAQIILGSGRKVQGTVKSFGILKDKMVHVTSYKEGSNVKYITTPTKGFNLMF
jgi:hypothetical protein